MKQLLAILTVGFGLLSCKSEKKRTVEENDFFPVVSFLKGQARQVDTGLYRIMKIESVDTFTTTSYIRREEFSKYAKDFLTLPDITSSKLRDDYVENKTFDEVLNMAILSYTTQEKDLPLKSQDVMLSPTGPNGTNDIKTIVIRKEEDLDDSIVNKTMVWYVNKRFTIISKVEKENQPEIIRRLEIIWNDFSDQQ